MTLAPSDLEATLRALPAPTFLLDPQGAVVAASEAGERTLDPAGSARDGLARLARLPPEASAAFETAFARCREGEPVDLELPWSSGGGSPLHVISLRPVPLGAATGVLVSCRPLSGAEEVYARALQVEQIARAEVEASDRRQTFLYQAMTTLFAHPPDPLGMATLLAHLAVPDLADWCLIDLCEENGWAQRAAVAHLDPSRERERASLVQRRFERRAGAQVGVNHVLDSGEAELVSAVTESLVRASASEPEHAELLRTLDVRSYMILPLRARGATLGAITLLVTQSGRRYGPQDLALAEDLCQRAGLAIDNARLYGEARRAVRAREDLLAIVSHDLKNPLGVIQLATALMNRGSATRPRDEQTTRQLGRIQSAANRMSDSISDLLDWGLLESGKLRLELARLPARALVEDALETVRPLAEAKHQQVALRIPEPELQIRGDRRRILQVFANLLGNAVKFTAEGGRVELGARPTPEGVEFWVSDSGKGISREHMPFLFERYWQAKDTAHAGTGLGLAISKGMVLAHGGQIRAESELGVGTTFRFELPRDERPAEHPGARVADRG